MDFSFLDMGNAYKIADDSSLMKMFRSKCAYLNWLIGQVFQAVVL